MTYYIYTLVKDDEFFLCAKFRLSSILCAEVIATDSHSHFPNVIKPIRPWPIIYLRRARTRRTEKRRREKKKGMVAPLAFILATLEIVRLLLLFRVYVWEALIMLTR